MCNIRLFLIVTTFFVVKCNDIVIDSRHFIFKKVFNDDIIQHKGDCNITFKDGIFNLANFKDILDDEIIDNYYVVKIEEIAIGGRTLTPENNYDNFKLVKGIQRRTVYLCKKNKCNLYLYWSEKYYRCIVINNFVDLNLYEFIKMLKNGYILDLGYVNEIILRRIFNIGNIEESEKELYIDTYKKSESKNYIRFNDNPQELVSLLQGNEHINICPKKRNIKIHLDINKNPLLDAVRRKIYHIVEQYRYGLYQGTLTVKGLKKNIMFNNSQLNFDLNLNDKKLDDNYVLKENEKYDIQIERRVYQKKILKIILQTQDKNYMIKGKYRKEIQLEVPKGYDNRACESEDIIAGLNKDLRLNNVFKQDKNFIYEYINDKTVIVKISNNIKELVEPIKKETTINIKPINVEKFIEKPVDIREEKVVTEPIKTKETEEKIQKIEKKLIITKPIQIEESKSKKKKKKVTFSTLQPLEYVKGSTIINEIHVGNIEPIIKKNEKNQINLNNKNNKKKGCCQGHCCKRM